MIFIGETYRDFFRQMGFAGEMIFSDPAIKPWRMLKDRENCTWEVTRGGKISRLHVKRFPRIRGKSPAEIEAKGYRLLEESGIPTVTVAAWGALEDGRSFIVTEDLADFLPADKAVEAGLPFERVLESTAGLAARLHRSGLHHRDLYLCHFMVREAVGGANEMRLIDAARVRRLPGVLTRRRWIVKDLAQFWYSTLAKNITDGEREEWLRKYCAASEIGTVESIKKSIVRKSAAIAAHDAKLRRREPFRNISIPRG